MDSYRPQRLGMPRKKKIIIFSSITGVILAVSVTIALILVFGGKKSDNTIDTSSEHSSSPHSPGYSTDNSKESSSESDYDGDNESNGNKDEIPVYSPDNSKQSSSESDYHVGKGSDGNKAERPRERSRSPLMHYYGDKWDVARNSRKSRSTKKKPTTHKTESTPSKSKPKDKQPSRRHSSGEKPQSQPGPSQQQCKKLDPQPIVRPIIAPTKLKRSEKVVSVFSTRSKPPVPQKCFRPRKNQYKRITETHDTDMDFETIFNPEHGYETDDEERNYVPFESIYELAGDKCRMDKAFPPKGKPQGHKFECIDLVIPKPSNDIKITKLVNGSVFSPKRDTKKICTVTFNNTVLVEKIDDDMEFTAVLVEEMRKITFISVISTRPDMERSLIQFVKTPDGKITMLTNYIAVMMQIVIRSTQ